MHIISWLADAQKNTKNGQSLHTIPFYPSIDSIEIRYSQEEDNIRDKTNKNMNSKSKNNNAKDE